MAEQKGKGRRVTVIPCFAWPAKITPRCPSFPTPKSSAYHAPPPWPPLIGDPFGPPCTPLHPYAVGRQAYA